MSRRGGSSLPKKLREERKRARREAKREPRRQCAEPECERNGSAHVAERVVH